MSEEEEHIHTVRRAWDAYHPDYMQFHLKERPDFHEYYANGGVTLDDYVIETAGDVRGLRLLDVCCACDASQAFSWANLGAKVAACDLSPVAIEIAGQNAEKIGVDITLQVADAQTLTPIRDSAFDLVFATYLCWFEDIFLACRNWFRVLRPEGRLLVHSHHPVTYCLEEKQGILQVAHRYARTGPLYYNFTGTDLADRHGGWGKSMPCVEFHHTLADVLNAVIEAGFALERFQEVCADDESSARSQLPAWIVVLARKPRQ